MPLRQLFILILMIISFSFTAACTQNRAASVTLSPSIVDLASATPIVAATRMMSPTVTPMTIVSDLQRVVYAKHDGVWLWDVSAPPKQLTHSAGDQSPKISDHGSMVAFLRGGDLWAVYADRGPERLLLSVQGGLRSDQFHFAPQSHTIYVNYGNKLVKIVADAPTPHELPIATRAGMGFAFSPDGSRIALLSSNRIDVIKADGSELKTVFTFPLVPGYIPEIVWLPDGSGFQTVIPSPDLTGHARFMFISMNGLIAAKLAEFDMSPAAANRSFIAPDGSKVLYIKPHGNDVELHTIDAGTADQAYFSHSPKGFGLLGWAADSSHFLYWLDDPHQVLLGPGEPVALVDVPTAAGVVWVDKQSFLFVHQTELRFRILGQPSVVLDDGLNESVLDFTTANNFYLIK